jgi:hypothetical protein
MFHNLDIIVNPAICPRNSNDMITSASRVLVVVLQLFLTAGNYEIYQHVLVSSDINFVTIFMNISSLFLNLLHDALNLYLLIN